MTIEEQLQDARERSIFYSWTCPYNCVYGVESLSKAQVENLRLFHLEKGPHREPVPKPIKSAMVFAIASKVDELKELRLGIAELEKKKQEIKVEGSEKHKDEDRISKRGYYQSLHDMLDIVNAKISEHLRHQTKLENEGW